MDKDTYEQFKSILNNGGIKAIAVPQLFETPAPIAARMVALANIGPGHTVLEPSAGTGAILRALLAAGWGHNKTVAVEIDRRLAQLIQSAFKIMTIRDDFLQWVKMDGPQYDRILMNPPFHNAEDIAHIKAAIGLLAPGGVLVALCAAGPRQQRELMPLMDHWEVLPPGTFCEAGTMVNVALMVYKK